MSNPICKNRRKIREVTRGVSEMRIFLQESQVAGEMFFFKYMPNVPPDFS